MRWRDEAGEAEGVEGRAMNAETAEDTENAVRERTRAEPTRTERTLFPLEKIECDFAVGTDDLLPPR